MTERIGIVVPALNEAEHIGVCLESLLALNVPENSEVLIRVFDGGSTDTTRSIVESYCQRSPNVSLHDNPSRTAPHAFNLGIAQLGAHYILIVGAHSTLDKDYLRRGITRLRSDDSIAVVGGVLVNSYGSETAEAISAAMSSGFGVGSAHFRTGLKSEDVDTVAFGIYRSSVLASVGGFDTDLARNQDDELSFRLRQAGYRIILDIKMRASYFVRPDFESLAKQYFQYGYWKVFVNRKHRRVTTARQLVPAAFVTYLAVMSTAIWYGPIGRRLLGLSPLAAYVALALRVGRRAKSPTLVMRAIVTLHLSYGAGYVFGIWDFLILRRRTPRSRQYRISR